MQTANPSKSESMKQFLALETPLAVNGGGADASAEPLALVSKYIIKIESGTTFLPALNVEYDHAPLPQELQTLHKQLLGYASALDAQQAKDPNSRVYTGGHLTAFNGLGNAFQNALGNLDAIVAGTSGAGTNAPASKIKISIGISFRPLTITISAEF